jgi:hypothetical protein
MGLGEVPHINRIKQKNKIFISQDAQHYLQTKVPPLPYTYVEALASARNPGTRVGKNPRVPFSVV